MIHVVNGAYLAGLTLAFLIAWPRTRRGTLWTIAGLAVLMIFIVRAVYARARRRERPRLSLPRRYRPVWARHY